MSRRQREGQFCGNFGGRPIRSHHFQVVNRWAARIEAITRGAVRVLRVSTDPDERHAARYALAQRAAEPRKRPGWAL